MSRKQILEKRLARLMSKRDALAQRALASQDANEVRSINEQITDLNADIDEVNEEIKVIDAAEAEEARNAQPITIPQNATPVNGDVRASFAIANPTDTKKSKDNPYGSEEYRRAFMNYVQRGEAIPQNIMNDINEYRASLPADMRAAVPATTADTGAAIPLTIIREIINTVRKRYGNLYAKARKMSIQGGVEFPIGALQANFKWIGESTTSPRQNIGSLGKISFGYYTAEIRIAQTFLSQLLTIEAFEAEITKVITIAYLKEWDYVIVNGSGDGQPTGILNDARVAATGNVITMSAADMSNWTQWRKKFFAKLPLGYRDGEFIFANSTVDSYLETMADANNNPIFRQATGLEVNDGDAMNPNGRFFGRNISLVEPDILSDFDAASSNDVIGIYWQPEEYAINENFGFTMRRYFDEETNEWVTKALVVADGKVLNPYGIWLIKKA